jgi:hypothetical protein
MRVLFLALREGLRFLYFARIVEEMKRTKVLPDPVELRVFCFPPSMRALLKACQSLSSAKPPPGAELILKVHPSPFEYQKDRIVRSSELLLLTDTKAVVTPNQLVAHSLLTNISSRTIRH